MESVPENSLLGWSRDTLSSNEMQEYINLDVYIYDIMLEYFPLDLPSYSCLRPYFQMCVTTTLVLTTQSAGSHRSSRTHAHVLENTSVRLARSAAVMDVRTVMKRHCNKNLASDRLILKWLTKVFAVSTTIVLWNTPFRRASIKVYLHSE
jgi:hypothetical protein